MFNEKASIDQENVEFNRFYNAFLNATEDLRFESDMDKLIRDKMSPNIWEVRMFSDNILLGCPIKRDPAHDTESLFGFIITDIITLQLNLALSGYFTRGGWVINSLYIDNNITFGSGLIEAYELERNKAIYPCIVLSNKVSALVAKHLNYYGDKKSSPQYYDLLKNERGQLFINYLDGLIDDDYIHFKELFIHKNIISTRLRKYQKMYKRIKNKKGKKEAKNILLKYKWLASYHNYFCKHFIIDCPKKYLIKGRNHYNIKRI